MVDAVAVSSLTRNESIAEIEDALDRFILAHDFNQTTAHLRFPPSVDISVLKNNGYFSGFPTFAGCIGSFSEELGKHEDLLHSLLCDEPIEPYLQSTGLALTPAACYPVYPAIAKAGPLPEVGKIVSVYSWCFRHEPSADPARRCAFRMREFVYLGSKEGALQFRESWVETAQSIVEKLDLAATFEIANDPFFGESAALMAKKQQEERLKYEILLPITSAEKPNACISFNYHKTHFSSTWGIYQANGELAHSACVGFGIERLTLAFLAKHGSDPVAWSAAVKEQLWTKM